MTLHWWQHWFWVTSRSPVVVVLLAALPCCLAEDVRVLGPHWGLVPVAPAWGPTWTVLHLPAADPASASGVAPALAVRRLLGFAALGGEVPTMASDGGTAGPEQVVTYLTTPGAASTSQPQQQPRESKAIGVFTTTLRPSATLSASPPSARPPSTATSVLEIVESVASTESLPVSSTSTSPSDQPSPPPSSSTTTEDAGLPSSSAEMPNDEPSKATSSPVWTTAESPSPSPSPIAAASPSSPSSYVRPMSLSTAPTAVSGAASPAPPTNSSKVVTVVHPGISAAPTPRTVDTNGTTKSVAVDALEPASSHRSAQAPLGAEGGPGKQHHVGALSAGDGLDAGSITGIVLGIVVFAGLVGTVSFVLYRRRYLNKPQTLNDKCSNPDSSGYIDDSTLRENSEEMYSLDNDSFLNSLEAMTIQNYWTDTVKHTKL